MRGDAEPLNFRRPLLASTPILALALALLSMPAPRAQSQAGTLGRWTTLSYSMPINPVHMALLKNGKVLIVSGSGNNATESNYSAALWDPQASSFATQLLGWDMFCNAMVTLPDGRVLINGGNLQYDPFHGQPRNAVYDPTVDVFTDIQNMAHGRWYPTATVLGDGRVMTFSGLDEAGATNKAVEFYTLGSGWTSGPIAGWTPPLYPRMHLLPDGRVLYSGSGVGSRFFTPSQDSNGTWSATFNTKYAGTRTYGTSVLLPLMPSDGYTARVMILGGGSPATNTTEILDLSATPLGWKFGPPMSQPRIEMNATILPSGRVLATGGSLNDEEVASASLNADLYNPTTNTFASAGTNAFARLYHSNSLLLPDATVALVGGNPSRGSYQSRIEIYEPAYLFKADGTAATRPVISSVTQGPLPFGSAFQVQTPDAATIGSVVLVRPGAPTHAFDMDQRLVGLTYSAGSGVLNVTAPPNGNIAPPGFYMLFVLNSAGVPSVATFVQLVASASNLPPSVSIASPLTNVTVNPGQQVSFSGTGNDPEGAIASYNWTFPGGSPSSSSQQNPGNVTYSTPGTYQASFTATDSGGLTSQAATRTITVTDFSLSATPTSPVVTQGGSATFTATVNPGTGFTGLVAFSVTGLPAGGNPTFSPVSVSTSGTTTLTVKTDASLTLPGSYLLRITGTSGPVSHSADVTLVVNILGDYTISVLPGTSSVQAPGSTTYTVTITRSGGFSSNVSLSVGSLPKFVTVSFSPASLPLGTSSSTATVVTKKQTKSGTSSLIFTATAGNVSRSSTVTLTVQ